MYSAVVLWRRDRAARGGTTRYASSKAKRGVQRSYASFTLRWGGIIILLFVVYHLLHLTWNVSAPGGASASPYERLVNGFQIWWLVLAYTIAMLAVGLHLRHGVWSALTTLGANTGPNARRRLNLLAYAVGDRDHRWFPPHSLLDPVRSGQLMSDVINSVDADSVYVEGTHRRHQGPGRSHREALGRAPVQRQAGQPGQPPQALGDHHRHRPGRRLGGGDAR